jgi:hypothetical protein
VTAEVKPALTRDDVPDLEIETSDRVKTTIPARVARLCDALVNTYLDLGGEWEAFRLPFSQAKLAEVARFAESYLLFAAGRRAAEAFPLVGRGLVGRRIRRSRSFVRGFIAGRWLRGLQETRVLFVRQGVLRLADLEVEGRQADVPERRRNIT